MIRTSLLVSVLAAGACFTLSAQELVTKDFTESGEKTSAQVIAYWTAEKMSAAVARTNNISGNPTPGPMQAVGPVVSSAGQKASMMDAPIDEYANPIAQAIGVAPQEAGNFNSYPYPFTRFNPWVGLYNGKYAFFPIFPYRAVGKLFFTLGRTNYVCSASVIRPHLLLTARHCVLDSATGWATNVVFYPGYANGANTKLKVWTARRLATWGFGGAGAGLKFDIGFIQTNDEGGAGCNGSSGNHPVEWYTGYLGWLYGGYVGDRNYTSMGYPQAAPFNGLWQVEAHSDVGNIDPLNQPGTFSMGNDMTGGSSGGPWLVNFGTSNYANGLNSYKWTSPNRPLEMNSPNFQADNFANLLTYAQGLACP